MDDKNTEIQIFRAALKIFHKKGLAGARMQEIADEAGINKSMLHYYYRSKEKLFSEVFQASLSKFSGNFQFILNQEDSGWEAKIRNICDYYVEFVNANPDLPIFLLNEMNQQPECLFAILQMDMNISQTRFFGQLQEAMERGEIRKADPLQVYVSLVSGIMHPFVAAPMMRKTTGLTLADWPKFLEERKEFVCDMIITYLKAK
jgi:TetR/AcrR family transcriptional regulator